MSDQHIDQILVSRAQQGDHKAFELLVCKYQRRLLRLLSRIIKDEHEVQDVAQETFIKAYRALPNFRGESAFYTWLYRIGTNTAKNHLQNRARHGVLSADIIHGEDDSPDVAQSIPDNRTPETDLLNQEIIDTVAAAVAKLPPELQQAISLREAEGLSYEDIALAMSCPIGTVRSRIYRAREAIAKALRPLLDVAEDQRW